MNILWWIAIIMQCNEENEDEECSSLFCSDYTVTAVNGFEEKHPYLFYILLFVKGIFIWSMLFTISWKLSLYFVNGG